MPKPAIFSPTWLDRAISYVAPTWGAHRMQSRMAMAVAQSIASGMVPGVALVILAGRHVGQLVASPGRAPSRR